LEAFFLFMPKTIFNFKVVMVSMPKSIEKCFYCVKTGNQRCRNHRKKLALSYKKMKVIEKKITRLQNWRSIIERIQEKSNAENYAWLKT